MSLINKEDLIAAYDRVHKGPPGGARKLIEDAPVVDRWIPVTEKLPDEKDTMFAKFWGTDRWNEYMFRRRSDLVEVTVEFEDGTRKTDASRTRDGKWDIEGRHGAVKQKVVAWKPMSAPWRGNVDAEIQNDKN